jgi:hypothetical protein
VNEELPAGQVDVPLQLCRLFFLGQLLLRTEIKLPIARLVAVGAEYLSLNDALAEEVKPVRRSITDPALQGPDGAFDLAAVVGFMLASHVCDRPGISELLRACEELPSPVARRLLWFIGRTEAVASMVFTRAWLWELNQEHPDWREARAVGQRAYDLARGWELPGLAQAAARAIARITAENLGGPDDALRIANEMAATIGWSSTQEDGVASILLEKGDASAALDIWRRVLPDWKAESDFDVQQSFSCRDAATAAGRLEQWREAADWLSVARARTEGASNPVYEAALLIDEGYARCKSGDNASALTLVTEGLQAIDCLPSDDVDEKAYILRKRAGHTIMWMVGIAESSPPQGFLAPPPACCSSLEPYSGPRVPSTPSDVMWGHLLQFEMATELGNNLLRAHEFRLSRSPYGMVRVATGILRIRDRLRTLTFKDFVQLSFELGEATELCRKYYIEQAVDGSVPLPSNIAAPARTDLSADGVFSVMVSGIFALGSRGAITDQIIESWRDAAVEAQLSAMLEPWLDLAMRVFVTRDLSALTVFRDASRGWQDRILASIFIAIDETSRPVELFMVHTFWAAQLTALKISCFPVHDVEHLVTEGWRRLATRPFLLRMPKTTVPEIERACAIDMTGWRKVGEVLMAAANAVPGPVPAHFHEAIRKLTVE